MIIISVIAIYPKNVQDQLTMSKSHKATSKMNQESSQMLFDCI